MREVVAPRILALDAATDIGWCYGPAGQPPKSGSFRCAGAGASRGAVFSGAGRWITAFLSQNPVDILVIEAPIPGSNNVGKTNVQTATILMGLPAVLEFMAYQLKVYEQERVVLASVRKHFIGKGNLKGDVAKPLVRKKCLALGWISPEDPVNYDRSDACAIWSYAESVFCPSLTQPVDDLFVKAQERRRAAEAAAAARKATTPSIMDRF